MKVGGERGRGRGGKKRKYIMDHDIKHAGEGFSSLEEGRRSREGGL